MRRHPDSPFRTGVLRRRAPTLREWAIHWLSTDAAKRPKTKKEDASALELHVFPTLGDTRLDAITVLDVRRLVARWNDEVMPRTGGGTRCCEPRVGNGEHLAWDRDPAPSD